MAVSLEARAPFLDHRWSLASESSSLHLRHGRESGCFGGRLNTVPRSLFERPKMGGI